MQRFGIHDEGYAGIPGAESAESGLMKRRLKRRLNCIRREAQLVHKVVNGGPQVPNGKRRYIGLDSRIGKVEIRKESRSEWRKRVEKEWARGQRAEEEIPCPNKGRRKEPD